MRTDYIPITSRIRDQKTAYFTMLSIIQGVAFMTLASDRLNAQSLNELWSTTGFIALVTLTAICMTWHEYARAATRLNWTLNWRDAFLPFLLGTGEFIACSNTHSPFFWFAGFAIWSFAGCISYCNTIKNAQKAKELVVVMELKKNYTNCSLLVLLAGLISLMSCIFYNFKPSEWEVLLVPWVALLAGLLLAMSIISILFEHKLDKREATGKRVSHRVKPRYLKKGKSGKSALDSCWK